MKRSRTAHKFSGTASPTAVSQYGWVKDVEPLTLTQFIDSYLHGVTLGDSDREVLRITLRSIARLPEGTPVAAAYVWRGVENRRLELEVHRVILYEPKS
jgi:hypothetical protein